MEYAVQTRDYKYDYRWNWEESGSDSLRAKVSLELQNLIEDGKPGVAVIFREDSYHVIITAIYKLGDKPIGTDFSSANIRLNLVFSQITLKKAKGLVQYYLKNQSNPGAAFSDIVTWSNARDKWTINEERIVDAFNSIPEGQESGMVLNCEKGSELQSLLDFDWGQTEGAKYVYQPKSSNPVRIAVDPIPGKPLPPPEPPKKTYGKLTSFLFMLLLITTGLAIGAGFEWYRCYKANDNISQLESDVQKAKSAQKKAEEERDKAKAEKEQIQQRNALFNKYGITVNDDLKIISISNGENIEIKGNSDITITGNFPITESYKKEEVQGTNYNVTKIKVKRNSNITPSPNVNR